MMSSALVMCLYSIRDGQIATAFTHPDSHEKSLAMTKDDTRRNEADERVLCDGIRRGYLFTTLTVLGSLPRLLPTQIAMKKASQ